MWEKTMLPETEMVDGKRVKTGRKVEATTLTFCDEFGSKLVFLVASLKWRELEGNSGDLQVELAYDDFNKKNKLIFKSFS